MIGGSLRLSFLYKFCEFDIPLSCRERPRGKMGYAQLFLLSAPFFVLWTLITLSTPLRSQYSARVIYNDFSKRLVEDSCRGRRIFMYDLPAKFNADVLKLCKFGLAKWLNICPRVANGGFGQPYKSSLGDGWFDTDFYMLEVIFHERMKQYRCLTLDPALADAVFVPYYAGLDALRYLYSGKERGREIETPHGGGLMSWLRRRREWRRRGGRDHFMVMGRTAWDFVESPGWGTGILEVPGVTNMTALMIEQRPPAWDFVESPGWGTGILEVPGVTNMTALMIEQRPWRRTEQAVPYPTSFHPSPGREIEEWTSRVRASTRTRLFAFAGSVRPYVNDGGFRSLLMRLCARSRGTCRLVDCVAARCSHEAEPVIQAFMESVFCLQPRGDTPTRRSTFDAIIAGCIPVFFHKDSAYTQYSWHLPPGGEENGGGYSVYIPEDDVIADESMVERVLRNLSSERVREMQENVVSLIPRVIYMRKSSMGNSETAESVRDAFDISVERVILRVSEQHKKERDALKA